jgi:hypothetical protein
MKPFHAGACLLLLTFSMSPARAADDEKAACFDAAEKGQTLRQAHRLIEARDQFRLCVAPICPATMRTDCSGWLDDAERLIPTVVLSAKDAAGNDAFDVTVTMDGAPLASKLDGAALPVDPGGRTFRFQFSDGAILEKQALVVEGRKAMDVAASLVPPAGPRLPPVPVASAPLVTTPSSAVRVTPHANSLRTAGWIVGGIGVAGLVVGGIFTGVTIADKSAADCNEAKQCSNYSSISAAQGVAPVAGIGLVAGGALLATGAVLLLLPQRSHELVSSTALDVRLAPLLRRSEGGIVLEGSW